MKLADTAACQSLATVTVADLLKDVHGADTPAVAEPA